MATEADGHTGGIPIIGQKLWFVRAFPAFRTKEAAKAIHTHAFWTCCEKAATSKDEPFEAPFERRQTWKMDRSF
ncbi:Hypothetical predicted protein [Cloeon dipterum]|uniref:Uncharacterized protein n=1 Tax=Cloeon dipterum TaxID=197152 RepID=A0A8S1CGA3_9INSE|nr:Hypothetical predicted protein [Cloeon dipterum]